MTELIIHCSNLESRVAQQLSEELKGNLANYHAYSVLTTDQPPSAEKLASLSDKFQIDINIYPETFNAKQVGLLITDMDSTLINIECVDEIADFAGKKPEVASITEAAMRGELDFNASLTRRVALLNGLNTQVLDEVYRNRLQLNPGAEVLIQQLRDWGIKTALVSGGFTFFTDKLKNRLDFDFVLSNVLTIQDNKLTGEISSTIVNAEKKAQFLQEICDGLEISTKQAVAVGDGANDLKMMTLAGLSVAYRAKPAVQQKADVKLNHSGLDSILQFLHYGRSN